MSNSNVIPFPMVRPSLRRINKLDPVVRNEATRVLAAFSWMWPADPPVWVADGWWNYVCLYSEAGSVEMTHARWESLWGIFSAGWLEQQEAWRKAVETSLRNLG